MPIEGPLRELGIHDVFQLLDLSRKTGVLRVTSQLRDDEGFVYFDGGRVVHARIRSKPFAIPAGSANERAIDRKVRQQIENTVFDLVSWREGFFSFEEREITDVPADGRVKITTESLLMEGARRIDEWSRIADRVPNLSVVPVLAPVSADHEGRLDLLPHEWEVLTMIDGQRDLRAIAGALGRSEFDIAKIAYGLVATDVIVLRPPGRPDTMPTLPSMPAVPDAESELELGFTAVRAGNLAAARASFEHFLRQLPDGPGADRARIALEGVTKLLTAMEDNGGGGRNG